ncbi:VWA domain-containing protein [Streptomyces luteireticuli]|uniref:VWFA domain-containing protein n=1 Tax=Streptomyces luteireticuli TaxID=173858 RepID=A0ABP3ISG7_9ACTN
MGIRSLLRSAFGLDKEPGSGAPALPQQGTASPGPAPAAPAAPSVPAQPTGDRIPDPGTLPPVPPSPLPPGPEPVPEPEPAPPMPAPHPVPEPEPAPRPEPEPSPSRDGLQRTGPERTGLDRVRRTAPGLVGLYKKAGDALGEQGLTGRRAAVHLVLDRSGSMRGHYRDGSVQHLAERVLALSAHLDDDGTVPLVFFSTEVDGVSELGLDRYRGRVAELHGSYGHMGRTNYHLAMRAVMENRAASGAPALVVFQTDGGPSSRAEAERALRESAGLPVFWQFVGFGEPAGRGFEFLRGLEEWPAVDNAGFFPAGRDPRALREEELYRGLTAGFAAWLTRARAAGTVR